MIDLNRPVGYWWRNPRTGQEFTLAPRDVTVIYPDREVAGSDRLRPLVDDGVPTRLGGRFPRLWRSVAAVRGVVGRVVTREGLRAAAVIVAVVAPWLVLLLVGSFR